MVKLSPNARFWLLTAVAVLVAGATFSLGQWQLRRAAQKQNLQLSIKAQSNLFILKAQDLALEKNSLDVVHRRASLKGVWRAEHTVFLDNRQMNDKPGFIAITPLVLDGTGQIILVQRGWAPRSFANRAALPAIETPEGPVIVSGRIAPPPSKLYEFKGAESGRIRQNIDVSLFSREIALPLLGVSMVQIGPANEGLLRDWAAPNVGVDKHYGYAFQWFGLCALVVGLYIWFQFIYPWRVKRKQSPDV
ncbi:MAG: SURF1 family protein [Polaromonas sp.]|nr:SURF1 family protein [Polaromonas sp.]